jgi:metal-responsive CopG/Arc/MetJ family transcriptional regulator
MAIEFKQEVLRMKKQAHIKFENYEEINKFRKEQGYTSFSEFVRDAINYFIGWLQRGKTK